MARGGVVAAGRYVRVRMRRSLRDHCSQVTHDSYEQDASHYRVIMETSGPMNRTAYI